MSLTAQGNSHLPTKIKKKKKLTSVQRTDRHLHVKKNTPRNHKETLSHAHAEKLDTQPQSGSDAPHAHTRAQGAQTHANITTTCFSKKKKKRETRTNDSNERSQTQSGYVFTLSDNILKVLSRRKSNEPSALIITCPK